MLDNQNRKLNDKPFVANYRHRTFLTTSGLALLNHFNMTWKIPLNAALIWQLTKRDFSERFAGSVLGSTWAMIWPLVSLFIYIVIFGRIMGGRLPGDSAIYAYGVYAASGLIPWVAFSTTVARSSSLFVDKRNQFCPVRKK